MSFRRSPKASTQAQGHEVPVRPGVPLELGREGHEGKLALSVTNDVLRLPDSGKQFVDVISARQVPRNGRTQNCASVPDLNSHVRLGRAAIDGRATEWHSGRTGPMQSGRPWSHRAEGSDRSPSTAIPGSRWSVPGTQHVPGRDPDASNAASRATAGLEAPTQHLCNSRLPGKRTTSGAPGCA